MGKAAIRLSTYSFIRESARQQANEPGKVEGNNRHRKGLVESTKQELQCQSGTELTAHCHQLG